MKQNIMRSIGLLLISLFALELKAAYINTPYGRFLDRGTLRSQSDNQQSTVSLNQYCGHFLSLSITPSTASPASNGGFTDEFLSSLQQHISPLQLPEGIDTSLLPVVIGSLFFTSIFRGLSGLRVTSVEIHDMMLVIVITATNQAGTDQTLG